MSSPRIYVANMTPQPQSEPVVYEREMQVESRQASVAETMRVARNVASRHAELLRRLA